MFEKRDGTYGWDGVKDGSLKSELKVLGQIYSVGSPTDRDGGVYQSPEEEQWTSSEMTCHTVVYSSIL